LNLTRPHGPMGLDELRARLESLLANQGVSQDRRAQASGLHDAMVEFKVALTASREARAGAERELAAERRQLEDAVRRGRLAEEIGDAETTRVATEFIERHRERSGILERKLAVITDEIAYLEREYQTLAARFQAARQASGMQSPPPAADLGDREFDIMKDRADQEARRQAVQAQLELLKKKLKKE
jgi:hypothetical protein